MAASSNNNPTNPFAAPPPPPASTSSSNLLSPDPTPSSTKLPLISPSGHKSTLSVLISQTSLDDKPLDDNIELPSAPPLSHELFQGETFDPSEFLLSRRHTGLEDLRSELRAYLATLRTSLVAVINTEYESFIGLSLGLRHASVASSLSTIRRPVLSIRSEVARVKDELDGMKHDLEAVLEERKAVREAKVKLRRLLEVEEGVEKVEGLLSLRESSGGKAREADRLVDSPAKRLARIAAEYSQMLYLVTKAGDLPFVHSLQPRIAKTTTTLQRELNQLLTTVLTPSSPQDPNTARDALTTLFRTYASLDLHSAAEDLVRRTVVKPFVARSITRQSLNAAEPSLPQTDNDEKSIPLNYDIEPISLPNPPNSYEVDPQPLVSLYNTILTFISRGMGLVLDVTERGPLASNPAVGSQGESGKKGFAMLTNVVWEEVGTRLMSELGSALFAAGRPNVFHMNHQITMLFLSRIESLCPTLSHLQKLRSSPTYSAFIKRFQLPVYFQLRFKEVVMSVERSLEGGSSSAGGGGGVGEDVFVLAESEAVWRAIKTCWSDDVFMAELAGRFWKLTLQLVSRYRTWLNSVVPRYVMPSSASTSNLSALSAGSAPNRSSFDGSRDKLSASATNTRPTTPSDDVSEEATLRKLTVLIADARLMEKKVLQFYEERIAERLPQDDDEGVDVAASILKDSLAQVTSIVPSLSGQIITILTKRCAEHLKHVRAVVSQVRASTRKGQNEPSFFVANILKDLRTYVGGPGKIIEEELRLQWANAVVEEVASRYAAILSTQHRQSDSLRWIKRGRQGLSFFGGRGGNAADDTTTDDDKVKQQMQLDIDALAQDALSVGVDVSKSAAFEGLRTANEEAGKDAEGKK